MPADPILKDELANYYDSIPGNAASLMTVVKLAIDTLSTFDAAAKGTAQLDRVKLSSLADAIDRATNDIIKTGNTEDALRSLTESTTHLIRGTLERLAAPRPKVRPR